MAETERKSNTGDYSGTKAPENAPHVQSELQMRDTLTPGGSHGAKAPIGMSELHRETVPNGATDPGQTDYGKMPPAGPYEPDLDPA